jgi:hypothetical protein
MGGVKMGKKFHQILNFDRSEKPKYVFERIEKICKNCSEPYYGTRNSRYCDKSYCKNACTRAWNKRNESLLAERRRKKNARQNNEKDIKSEVKVLGICNYCGSSFTPESKWHQYCNECKRTHAFEHHINRYESVDWNNLIELNIGENESLMSIIESEYPQFTSDEDKEYLWNIVADMMEDKYGESVFEELV